MDKKLEPCRCGCKEIVTDELREKKLHTYTFYCKNPECNEEPIIVFSHSELIGYQRAVRAWNRRNKDA
jgi:hypothetical protein